MIIDYDGGAHPTVTAVNPNGSLQSNLKGWIESRALNFISDIWASADHFTVSSLSLASLTQTQSWCSGEFHQRDAELIRSVLKLPLREIGNWFCSQKRSVSATSRERLKWISLVSDLCVQKGCVRWKHLSLCVGVFSIHALIMHFQCRFFWSSQDFWEQYVGQAVY